MKQYKSWKQRMHEQNMKHISKTTKRAKQKAEQEKSMSENLETLKIKIAV